MSEDMNKALKQISEMLSQENFSENLKGLLSMLANSGSSNSDSPPKASESAPTVQEDKSGKNELSENIDMLRKMKRIMDRMNSINDTRINLLLSIKPFLNPRRQKKLVNCVNILRLSNMTRMLDESDK